MSAVIIRFPTAAEREAAQPRRIEKIVEEVAGKWNRGEMSPFGRFRDLPEIPAVERRIEAAMKKHGSLIAVMQAGAI